jgi:hypothetical protein
MGRTNFGHEFHIPTQGKMLIWKCARKHLICQLQLNEYLQQFSINVRAGIAGDCLVGPHVCHIGLQATAAEMSSDMICQSYRLVLHWQSEHESGTCTMVLRHNLAVLCEMFSATHIMTDGSRRWPTAWRPRSTHFNSLDFYLYGHLKTLVYAAPVDNEEAIHRRIVDACQNIRKYPSISERMRQSMMRRVEACTEPHGGHFEHFFKCVLSRITQFKYFRTRVDIDIFSCFGMCNSYLKFVRAFVTTCISGLQFQSIKPKTRWW